MKPANQIQLTEKQLGEEFVRSLSAARPGPPNLLVRYNLEERGFKPEPQLEQAMVHYSCAGVLLPKDSEEGQKLIRLHAAAGDEAATEALPQVRCLG